MNYLLKEIPWIEFKKNFFNIILIKSGLKG